MGERWELFREYSLERARTPSMQAALEVLMDDSVIPPADLARISVPTTLIWGRHDRATPLRIAETASARYGWSLHVIEDAADDPAVEAPEAFLAALRSVLDSRSSNDVPTVTGDWTERLDTVIIGAGQAGLSVGYHLARHHRSFVILDANERIGDPGASGGIRFACSPPPASTGCPACASRPRLVRFPPRTRPPTSSRHTRDDSAFRSVPASASTGCPGGGDRYVVTAGDGRFEADNVVVATGAFRTPGIPAFARNSIRGSRRLHSSAYRNLSQLRDGGVLVVGAGNSGAEIALEVARAGTRPGCPAGTPARRPHSGWQRARPAAHPRRVVPLLAGFDRPDIVGP